MSRYLLIQQTTLITFGTGAAMARRYGPQPCRPKTGMGVRDTYDEVRSRFVWRTLDALLTAGLAASKPGRPASPSAGGAVRSYRRAQQFMNALTRLLPGDAESYRRRLFQPGQLPFAAERVTLLSYGSAATVFLLEGASPQDQSEARVLKVWRRSLGRRLDTQLAMVRAQRAVYDRLVGWYEGCSVVLPTVFFILHGPLLAGAAASCVQPYVAGDYTDILWDLSEPELLELLADRPRLQAQFRLFVERTLRSADEEAACVDIVGRNNLVVTGVGDDSRLVLLDNGIYNFDYKAMRSPGSLAFLKQRLAYLRHVCEQLTDRYVNRAIAV